jgi:hypothetical protein
MLAIGAHLVRLVMRTVVEVELVNEFESFLVAERIELNVAYLCSGRHINEERGAFLHISLRLDEAALDLCFLDVEVVDLDAPAGSKGNYRQIYS